MEKFKVGDKALVTYKGRNQVFTEITPSFVLSDKITVGGNGRIGIVKKIDVTFCWLQFSDGTFEGFSTKFGDEIAHVPITTPETIEERSLLVYFETCIVDNCGVVDGCRMIDNDFDIAKKWSERGYISFGRICSTDVRFARTHWVEFSDKAWTDAHVERKQRAQRLCANRKWRKTSERED
jgi:hypothetical protein